MRAQHQSGAVLAPQCPYCGADSVLVTGQTVYPRRPDLWSKYFYLCSPCKAYVGCHPGTTKPLGRLANAELRTLKSRAHAAFDPIWKDGCKARGKAYGWLAAQLGISKDVCHIGMFDEDTCKRVIKVCNAFWLAKRAAAVAP